MFSILKNCNKNKISLLFLFFILIISWSSKNSIYSLNNFSGQHYISSYKTLKTKASQNNTKINRGLNIPFDDSEEILIEEKKDKLKANSSSLTYQVLYNNKNRLYLSVLAPKNIIYCPNADKTPNYIKFCSLKFYS